MPKRRSGKLYAIYVDQDRAIIRSDGGCWGWNVGSLAENQVLKAKVRVRRNKSGRVGTCLTQEGDRPGAVAWLSGDQTVTRAALMFAKTKPPQLDREFYAPDIVHPAEEWNEVQLALQHGSLHIFVNAVHLDTMEFLSSEAPTRANVAFSIQATSEGPQHLVRLTKPYYISVHEVTQKNYMDVMGTNPSHFSSRGEGRDAVQNVDTWQFPVENVNYDDTVAFFGKLQEMESGESPSNDSSSKCRLPSEAEWEFTARAGLSTSSAGIPQNLTQPTSRQTVNSQGSTGPVGEYPTQRIRPA